MPLTRVRGELNMVRRLVYRSLFDHGVYRPRVKSEIVDQFHKLYYDASVFDGTWQDTRWLGVGTRKCPFDLWIYQEMLYELRPDVIVECGTLNGGSALYFASICDLLGNGQVVTIDIEERPGRPEHDRVTYLVGSSTAPEIVERVRELIAASGAERVLVILDSDHSRDHVLAELRAYAGLVTPGSYIVVEDTNVNGHPVEPDFGPGPMEALHEFLRETRDFEIDSAREKFYLTFNPRGYLRRRGDVPSARVNGHR
jgi:cephalosporin hydroxylase